MNDLRAIALRIRARVTDAGRAFAFHFFLRYGDYTEAARARDCALARQFFTLAASEALARHQGLDEADRQLLTEYALAVVEVAFNERLRALAAENAERPGGPLFRRERRDARQEATPAATPEAKSSILDIIEPKAANSA